MAEAHEHDPALHDTAHLRLEIERLRAALAASSGTIATAESPGSSGGGNTERELAAKNAALIESEARFRTLVEGMPQLVWRAVDGGCWTWASPQWTTYTGLSMDDSLGHGWLQALHPDDRSAARAEWARASSGSHFDVEARIYHKLQGRYRHFRTRASSVRGADGTILEWLGTSTDVDDLLKLQHRQKVLLAELQHRVRNMLTVVRSVFGRTVEAGGDLETIADHFSGRLNALARTQVIGSKTMRGETDLESLIRDEFLTVGVTDGPSVTIEGPSVSLPLKVAQTLGLAIHELTTNAVKYGAFAQSQAKLDVRWEINMDCGEPRSLDLSWIEQGMPAIAIQPSRRGFGRELIEEALPYQLGADTELEFRGGGVRCWIRLPLPEETVTDREIRG
ncbi:PAS domain-containing protein [uncultured Sphingomonas sp.]|uniref:sensor histidine kinase n=1 Tax=uncultured Sphingomonas sp. TaxID=158754 RepID=UPI0025F340D0|nr:PAS domain-containing protein [uncultured Sphingomonas sp.]